MPLTLLPRDNSARRVAAFLMLLCAALAGLLIFGDKPWHEDIAARFHQGERLRLKEYITFGVWWGAAFNLAMTSGLLTTVRWWMGASESAAPPGTIRAPQMARWFVVLTAAAMLLCAGLGWARLSMSLWDDEEYSLRRCIYGEFEQKKSGGLAFKPVPWSTTLWYYRKPNNHVPFSITARLSLNLWQTIARPDGLAFNEAVLRAPAFIAGILAIGSAAVFLWRIGCPRAGVLAAFILAIHPWHLRYITEARGYGFALLFTTLSMTLLLEALARGAWRWWLAFAGSGFLLLYSYPGALYFSVLLNLIAVVAILRAWRGTGRAWRHTARWAVANVFAAMLWIQVMAPCLPQMQRYLAGMEKTGMGRGWIQNELSYFASGMAWNWDEPGRGHYPELIDWAGAAPAMCWMAIIGLPVLAALGVARLLWRRDAVSLLAFVLFAPALLLVAHSSRQGYFLWPWYLIFMLPCLVALIATGLDWLPACIKNARVRAVISVVLMGGFLAWFAVLTEPPRRFLRTSSVQPSRESVLMTRPALDPFAPGNAGIMTAFYRSAAMAYDPRARIVRTVAELEALMQQAVLERRPLFVNAGVFELSAWQGEDVALILRDSRQFERTGILYGFEPLLTRHVFRYAGAEE